VKNVKRNITSGVGSQFATKDLREKGGGVRCLPVFIIYYFGFILVFTFVVFFFSRRRRLYALYYLKKKIFFYREEEKKNDYRTGRKPGTGRHRYSRWGIPFTPAVARMSNVISVHLYRWYGTWYLYGYFSLPTCITCREENKMM
jgi:hypothetical protein